MSNASCFRVTRIRMTCVKGLEYVNFDWPVIKHDDTHSRKVIIVQFKMLTSSLHKNTIVESHTFSSRDFCQRKMYYLSMCIKLGIPYNTLIDVHMK